MARAQIAGMYLKGDKPLIAALNSFGDRDFISAILSGARSTVTKVVAKDARRRALRAGHPNIAKGIAVKTKRYAGRNTIVLAMVGVVKARVKKDEAQTRRQEYFDISKVAHLIAGGTKPHEIKARGVLSSIFGKRSSWAALKSRRGETTASHLLAVPIGGGEFRYLKSVQHPGTRAQPFLVPALVNNFRRAVNDFSINVGKAVERKWDKKYAGTIGGNPMRR